VILSEVRNFGKIAGVYLPISWHVGGMPGKKALDRTRRRLVGKISRKTADRHHCRYNAVRRFTCSLELYYILSGELFDESGKFRAELAKHRQGEAEIARWKSPFLIKTFAVYRLVISEARGLLLMGTRD